MGRVLGLILLLLPVSLYAQKSYKLLFGGVSANAYSGDLASYEKWTAAFHLGLKFNAEKRLNGNITIGFGHITGQNIDYSFDDGSTPPPSPNKFFRTSFFFADYELNFNIIHKKQWKLFISQGAGLMRFNPQDEFNDPLQEQPETRAPDETYGNVTLILPTQLGVLYQFPNYFGLSAQVGIMNPLTDYLDNISQYSNSSGNDQMLSVRMAFHVPLGLGKLASSNP